MTFGPTDGPPFQDACGTWLETYKDSLDVVGTQKRVFIMNLTRKFVTGHDGSAETDIGEFEYVVERSYTGEGNS